jgi:hypothetical protein
VVLITATPVPYKPSDFGGLLALIQSPTLNTELRADLNRTGSEAPHQDPYAIKADGTPLYPDRQKYICTYTAFERFFSSVSSPGEMGRRLFEVWQRTMIRREYSSKCVVNPAGDIVRIGDNMPETQRRLVRVSYDRYWQDIYDKEAEQYKSQMSSKNPNARSSSDPDYVLNGRTIRILNFGSTSPLLFYAKFIHDAKEPSKKGPGFTENRNIADLRDEFNKGTEAGDQEFLRRLMVDIRTNLFEAVSYDPVVGRSSVVDGPLVTLPLNEAWFTGDLENVSAIFLAHAFVQSSPRIKALLLALIDQVAAKSEKAIVFTANPFEQQLVTIILRRSGLLANALLATMAVQDKEELIARFNSPLLRVHRPGSDQNHGADVEVIVLSYFMNSGLNLHPQCANLHCLTPPPSYPTYIQTVGRISRFGQRRRCLVISYAVDETFNVRQLASLTANALPAVAAAMLEESEDMAVRFKDWLVIEGILAHPGSLDWVEEGDREGYDVRTPTNEDISMYMFNASMGRARRVITEKGAASSMTVDQPLFPTLQSVPTPANTPRKPRIMDAFIMKQDTDNYANAIEQTSNAAKDLSFMNYTDSDGMMAIAEGLGVNFSDDNYASESEEPDPMDGDDWQERLRLEELTGESGDEDESEEHRPRKLKDRKGAKRRRTASESSPLNPSPVAKRQQTGASIQTSEATADMEVDERLATSGRKKKLRRGRKDSSTKGSKQRDPTTGRFKPKK